MSDLYSITLDHFLVFPEVMREPRLCRRFLEQLLGVKIRKLEFVQKEADFKESVIYRGIRLDVYVEDDANSVYDVEMQNSVESFKRVRYYQSGIDRQVLKSSGYYTDLKTSFIIMVCNYDPTRGVEDPKDPAS
ncbi:MAG: PD-(D/E)XK nuclease family transposase, partial [Clostridia bacterium]|nr:PD-(D/E)XK nuclease family transposase [Clostridia bacterium]